MAKKDKDNNLKIDFKPKEILDLENTFGLSFKEIDDDDDFANNAFKINNQGKITALWINDKRISDVSPLSNFPDLEKIDLSGCSIEDITPLARNKKLRYLYLQRNKIKDISSICDFKNLHTLFLEGNGILNLETIKCASELRQLDVATCNITDISFVQDLKNLEWFFAENNRIRDIEALSELKFLQRLWLHNNLIQDINSLDELLDIEELELDLSGNQIKTLSSSISFKLVKIRDRNIVLKNNPLFYPPPSVMDLGEDVLRNYYEGSGKFGHAPLSEGRIIFVGGGESGKSSIIEKMLDNTFIEGKPQTDGIAIKNWALKHPGDGRDLLFHIWDFGGQEIQHAVHKFFFTEGCLYVLVLNNRKEDEPEYWLQQIESLGNRAPVIIAFNKYDQNPIEIVDRKFLREKYPNIVGFYNTSCKTGLGIEDLKNVIEQEAVKLRTVEEEFPNNWFSIKKAIEERTSGEQHYLSYEVYKKICEENHTDSDATQKLLLKYFNTIGAVTWFGDDTYLNLLHVLNPAWITEGVYKIVTSPKTSRLFGQIQVNDFKEMLHPKHDKDYTYDEKHYGYILSMMKRFDLCYTPDDKNLLIPSAFGKEPKVEYKEFIGEGIRTYILQFKDYMPMALIHRFIAKRLPNAYDNNYWYSGIVIKDSKSDSLSMVQADKEAKRIYVRVKGSAQLGMWEDIRRELHRITTSYAKIPYAELVALDEQVENTVNYEDLVSHLKAKKSIYFHSRLQQDFNVGYLMGLFESVDDTFDKFKKGEIKINSRIQLGRKKVPTHVIQILNNNSPTVNTHVSTQVNVDIDINIVNNISSTVKGDAGYLLEELDESNNVLREALQKVVQFADHAKAARNSGEVKEKGWARKLKGVIEILGNAGEQVKNIKDGGDALSSILSGLKDLAVNFSLDDIASLIMNLPGAV